MDKSYIVRVYEQTTESVSGVVEDVQRHKREPFSNSDQLWELVTRGNNEPPVSNVISSTVFNTTRQKT